MKNAVQPGDQKSREAILQETERNVFVQASAGTGKTTLMVERVVELIKKGIPLDKLAVVTFTNPAAAELRVRIRNRLRIESSTGSRECSFALRIFSSSWISTIHGFASRILKEYFNFTGVDPSFSVTETHFTPIEISREWDRWLLEFDVERDENDIEVLIRTDTSLQKEIALGIESRRWMDSVENVGGTTAAEGLLREYAAVYESEMDSVLRECTDHSDRLFNEGSAFLEGIRKLKKDLKNCRYEDVTGLYGLINTGHGKSGCWEDKENAQRFFGEARDKFKKIGNVIMSGELTEQTWNFASPFARELRNKWDRDRSRLSFSDLLYVTWEAVAGNGKLADCLAERFHHILIDEFQDTSSEQAALFEAFLQHEGKLPDGCITVVADDKQSIYGWRNADIETYNDFRNRLEAGGALSETITTNFRSSRNIVRFVNIFGTHLFRNQTIDEIPFGCEYSPIEPRSGAPEGCPVRTLTLPEMPDELKTTYNRNAYGALLQAEWFAAYVKEGFRNGNTPGDYALLYRSGTHLHHFIDVLEREKIPYHMSSSRDFLKRPEIADLRELLRCLLYSNDKLAWVHTLRSLFFGISDNSINAAVRSGTNGYKEQADECPRDVREANRQLRRLRRSILTIPVADFLFELLFQTEMVPVLSTLKYQETRRLGNLQYVLEQVLSGEILSPIELLRALDEKFAPERTEEPTSVPTEGGAVTVTTIHGAKGLAWKHVVLASMPTRSHGREGKVISYDHRKLAAFNLGVSMDDTGRNRMKSPFWPEIKKIEKAREKAELRRLLYVAVTRPRDSLVIIAEPVSKANESDGFILWQTLQSAQGEVPECCLVEEMRPVDHFPGVSPVKYEFDTTDYILESDDSSLFEIAPEPEGWQPEGAEIGDRVHAVMEKIDFCDPGRWFKNNEIVLRQVYLDDYDEIKELSMNFFRMDLPFDLRESKIIGREYPYVVKTPAGMKSRYIDLLLSDNRQLTVVDYKTDSFRGSSVERTAEAYLDTQRHYIRDISEIFGLKTCGYLVFLREGIVYPVILE